MTQLLAILIFVCMLSFVAWAKYSEEKEDKRKMDALGKEVERILQESINNKS